MTGDNEPVEEGIDLDAIRQELAEGQAEIDEIGERISRWEDCEHCDSEGNVRYGSNHDSIEPCVVCEEEIDELSERITQWDKKHRMMCPEPASGAAGHIHWLLARYTELLDDIHGEKCFTEEGADHGPELVARIRALGPDYVKCFLPAELWDDQFQD
tara:strand:- start:3333 stop:3803 length:471 start_codon:yes stop_codon:yes gene_type:complete